MNIDELKKEVEKYKSIREKVLRLSEITKFTSITYGLDYIYLYIDDNLTHITDGGIGKGGCIFCWGGGTFPYFLTLKVKNCNKMQYFSCNNCKDKTLCAYCLREKETCSLLTKQKVTFWLCFPKMPKDIRKLITNLFFSFLKKQKNKKQKKRKKQKKTKI